MRALVQCVDRAWVDLVADDGAISQHAAIDAGLLILVGSTPADTEQQADKLVEKIINARILPGEQSLQQTRGEALVVSQFTLYADARRGRRPSYSEASPAAVAQPLYDYFCQRMEAALSDCGGRCASGVFGAHMKVGSINDGPYTLWLDTAVLEQPRRSS